MADGSNNSEIWAVWDKGGGKQKFLQACGSGYNAKEKRLPICDKTGGPSPALALTTELIQRGIKGQIKKDSIVSTLQDLLKQYPEFSSSLLDILSITDLSSANDGPEDLKERNNYAYIVRECEKIVSDKLLKERLEIDSLQEVGILKNRTFYSKFIKVKTKLYYKQRKYNLFREECEGFAKLQTALNQKFDENSANYENLLDLIHSLIGCFNLDPNRVLDIILESFENQSNCTKLFVPLICAYVKDAKIVNEVLASKFTFLRYNEKNLSRSLYILTAQLLQHNIVAMDDIYHWLTPEDKVMFKESEKASKDAKEYIRKLHIISTNSKEKEDEPEEPINWMERYNSNQKLRLCEALLAVGDWKNAHLLISRMPDFYCQQFQPIAMALCKLIHITIDPLYRKHWHLASNQPLNISLEHNTSTLEQIDDFQQLRENVIPMLRTLGASLRFDSILFYKILRISRAALYSYGIDTSKSSIPNDSDNLYYDILTVFDTTLLPSLCYMDCQCCLSEEIWSVLKLYPYQSRYCLYNRWKNNTHLLYPDLMRKKGDAEKQIKDIMKRVSRENVKPVGRLIGKLTHNAPGFLFDYILLQIQVYNNLIHPVVDSLKYLTNLSYDMLGFCLVECLANADKKRVKHDSTSISNWLQSLSSFCGAIYKKYVIDLTGLLQYVANQLKVQKSLDLLILKEVVQRMAGVEMAKDLTMDQVYAMAGGELLKAEAGYFSQVRNTKKSSLRLKDALFDHNLAMVLCLLMAQQKNCVVYRETQSNHLKLVGKLADQCQDTLVQFGTFLMSTLTADEYVNRLPTIHSMLLDYHISNEVAFFLARPMFNHAINVKYDHLRKQEKNYKSLSSQIKNDKYFEAVRDVMEPVHRSIIPLHPTKTWEDISPQFLTTFWSLTMYDLHVPDTIYQQVVEKTKQQSLAAISEASSSSKGKKEQERFTTLIEKLHEEKRKQQEHVTKVIHRLEQEKDTWFLCREVKSAKNETITRFLQLCLFPRCTFTSIDAVYCAKFVQTIHMLRTPNFCTLLCYDRLFCDITYSVTSCTENEAMCYGRFLYAMLETIMRWHRSQDLFEKECANYPGFVTKYRVNNQHADSLDHVNYENYRHVVHKWHYKLAKAMVICLESKDYVQIRNALIILIKIIAFFPVLQKLAQFLEKRIEKVRDEEKNNRQDLYTLSISYVGLLKQRIAGGHMIIESDFHTSQDKGQKGQDTTKTDPIAKPKSTITTTNTTNTSTTLPNPNSSDSKDDELKEKRAKIDELKSTNNKSQGSQSPADLNTSRERSSHNRDENRDKQHRSSNRSSDTIDKDVKERDKRRDEKMTNNSSNNTSNSNSKSEERKYRNDVHYSTSERQSSSSSSHRHYCRGDDRDGGSFSGGGSGANNSSSYPLGGATYSSSSPYNYGMNSSPTYPTGNSNYSSINPEFSPTSPHSPIISYYSPTSPSYIGQFKSPQYLPTSPEYIPKTENDRDTKRRKMDSGTTVKSSSKHEDRKQTSGGGDQSNQANNSGSGGGGGGGGGTDFPLGSTSGGNTATNTTTDSGKTEKKERSSKSKDKRDRLTDEEKELRKERKINRKRDRIEEVLQSDLNKRRRDDDKGQKIPSHQNGDAGDMLHLRDKHHRNTKEISPHGRDRNSHEDRMELRDKHRRNPDSKRR